jgi:hypothetical protein
MAQNGEVNKKLGIYRSLCCGAEVILRASSTFPDCPNHPRLTTIWKPVVDEKMAHLTTKKPEPDPAAEVHVENRRLWDLASGRLKLEEWEQNHLHGCSVCQDVLYVFVRQPITGPGNPEKPNAAGLRFFSEAP